MKYVVGFVFTEDKRKVVLILKNSPEWQKGLLNGVGGKVEGAEAWNKAMSREFEEETGVKTMPGHWTRFARGYSGAEALTNGQEAEVLFYKMFNDEIYKNAKTTEKEVINKFWVSQLPDYSLIPNLKWLIPLALSERNTFANFNI